MSTACALAEAPLPLFAPAVVAASPAVEGEEPDRRPGHRSGHRERLRERFLSGGAGGLPDHELLEMLLFLAVPRGDVAPLARRLLAAFGTLGHVMAASPARLGRVPGAGPRVVEALKAMEALGHRMARAEVIGRPVLSSWDALLRYLRTAMAHQSLETVRVLYLDRKNALVADEEAARGTVDHVPVYPREVIKRALELEASALILVHNHPSGDPTPSEADLRMTAAIRDAGAMLGITLHDHIVVGAGREVSFRSEGLL